MKYILPYPKIRSVGRVLVILGVLYAFFGLGTTSFAATQTSEDTVTVSANVTASNTAPSAPVLVSPTNNSYVNDSTPKFVWEESTDSDGSIDHYTFSLDGATLYSNVPTTDIENANYILDYNAVSGEYGLTPKSSISDGSHTWKVRAVDNLNEGADSATWTFTVDTQAPTFVVSAIGDQSVNISAQDATTIPSTPIELGANSPLIVATGEASSSVDLTVTIPGDPTQSYTVAVDTNGDWSQQLGILPRDIVMTLDFIITDQAGNVSALSGVEFTIPTETITFPPTSPSPTPSPSAQPGASPSPSPTPTPGVTPIPTPPTSPPPSPIIEIPILPPEEIINEIVQEISEAIPPAIRTTVQRLPETVVEAVSETIQFVAPVSSLAATAAVPTFSILAFLSQFGQQFSFKLLIRLLQALGLLPAKKPQGLVFNSQTNEPVAFALLTVTSVDTSLEEPIHETVVTNVDGVYQGLSLPPGTYVLNVSHQDFTFPSQVIRPQYLNMNEHYLGEPFTVGSIEEEQLFLIPVDPIAKSDTAATKSRLKFWAKLILSKLNFENLTLPLFIFSLFIALIYPSVLNWIIVGVYLTMLIRKIVLNNRVPTVGGQITDPEGLPVEHAVIRISQQASNQLAALITTDEKGEFKAFIKPDKYQITVTKPGMVWTQEGGPLSFQEIDTSQESQFLSIGLTDINQIYQELFGTTPPPAN